MVQHCKVVVCENQIVFKETKTIFWMRNLWAHPSGKGLGVCIIVATEYEYNHYFYCRRTLCLDITIAKVV